MALLQNLTTGLQAMGQAIASLRRPTTQVINQTNQLRRSNTLLSSSHQSVTHSSNGLNTSYHRLNESQLSLSGTLKAVLASTIAWNDEVRRQVRGTIIMGEVSGEALKDRILFLEKEARGIQMLSGLSDEASVTLARGIDSAFSSVGKNIHAQIEREIVGTGLFSDVVSDLAGQRKRSTDEIETLKSAALATGRATNASAETMVGAINTAVTRLQLDESQTTSLLDEFAVATKAYGMSGEQSYQTLVAHLDEIQRVDIKDRLSYSRRLLTTAGMMEKAGIDMLRFSGTLHPEDGAKGMQQNAMAAAILGMEEKAYFALQQRMKLNDTSAIKEMGSALTAALGKQAPAFSVDEWRKEQAGTLDPNIDYQRVKAGQEQASVLLGLIGMNIKDYASFLDSASRTKNVEADHDKLLKSTVDSRENLRDFLSQTDTMGDSLNRYKGIVLGFFDELVAKSTRMAQSLGININENSVRSTGRDLSAVAGTAGVFGAGMLGKTLLSRLLGSGAAAAATSATTTGAAAAGAGGATAAAASKVPLAVAALWVGAGIKTALSSKQAQAEMVQAYQTKTLGEKVVSGLVDPVSNIGLMAGQIAENFKLKSKEEESISRLRYAQALELEVQTKMKTANDFKREEAKTETPKADPAKHQEKQLMSQVAGLLERMVALLAEIRDNGEPSLVT